MQHRRKRKLPVALALLVVLGGGFAYLLTKEIPVPQEKIEKPLDSARFLKN